MRPGQALGALQDALVLAADQHQGAGIVQAHQVAYELDAIHLRHLQIAEDQVGAAGMPLQVLHGHPGPLADGHLVEAEGLQLASQQFADEGVVINYEDFHRVCLLLRPDCRLPATGRSVLPWWCGVW
ncbi:hypothetical protein D3C84_851840 [compost metagenome]